MTIAELEARLGEHLRYVRRGHSLTVLDRDTLVAMIVPVTEPALLSVRKPRAGAPKLKDVVLPRPLQLTADPVALLIAEREMDR